MLPAAIDFQWHHATRQQLSGVEVGADGNQSPVVEQHVRPFENAVRFTRPHRGISDPHGLGRKPFRHTIGRERVHHTREVECWSTPCRQGRRGFGGLNVFWRRSERGGRVSFGGACFLCCLGVAYGRPIGPLSVGGLARTLPNAAFHPHISSEANWSLFGGKTKHDRAVVKGQWHFHLRGVVQGPRCLPRSGLAADLHHIHAVVHIDVVTACEVQGVAVPHRCRIAAHVMLHNMGRGLKKWAVRHQNIGHASFPQAAKQVGHAQPGGRVGSQRTKGHFLRQTSLHSFADA